MSVTPDQCVTEIQAALQSIAQLQNKSIFVYDDDDLQDKLKGVTLPAAGIVYEGMRSLGDGAQGSLKFGMSAEAVFSIIIVTNPETIVRTDSKTPVILLMNSIRSSMLHKKSVTGHFYRFVVEAPAVRKKGLAFWVQRWSVPIQLPPGQANQIGS